MPDTQAGVRLALAPGGSATVSTGLPVLDHLIGELAASGRFRLTLEVAPDGPDQAASAAARALGASLAELLAGAGAAGVGGAVVPSDEALALASLERDEEPRLVSNVEFSDQRVGGLATDVASGFLRETAEAAQVNLHVRLLEGTDPQHVLTAIYKAVGAALGQACRPAATDEEG
jgi:imidazoleglycerol phosphate dehydratase HisB